MSERLEDKIRHIHGVFTMEVACHPEKGDFFSAGALKPGAGDFWVKKLNFVGWMQLGEALHLLLPEVPNEKVYGFPPGQEAPALL